MEVCLDPLVVKTYHWSKQLKLKHKQNVILFLCILETVQTGGHKIKERIEPVCPAGVPILNNMPGLCALTVRPQLQPEYDKNRVQRNMI